MKLLSVLLLFVMPFVVACSNVNQQQPQQNTADTTTFFDVHTFFKNEIQQVQTTPYFIYSIFTNNNQQKDSTVIGNKDFAAIANEFAQIDIRSTNIRSAYVENAFNDLTTKSVTLNYSTNRADLPIKSIDVLLDNEKNTVKRIFVKSIQDNADSSIIKQYSWKAGKSFLITTTILTKQGTKYTNQRYVNWNE